MRLEVTRSEQLPIVTAETTIVGRPTINRPQDNDELNILPNNTYRFLWSEAVGAAFYDVILYFHYNEFHIDNPLDIQSKEVVWKVSGVITANELEVPGLEFYQFLRATIPANSQLRRTFEGMDVQVRAGGQELYEFQRVQLANSGITSAGGDIPQYTNLSEGVGIFSSANRHTREDLELRPQALDSLKDGSITEPLNFIQ
jgi:hypothetical protein